MASLLDEFRLFKSQGKQMQILLKTNLVFAFVIPVIELFVGAYIIRNSKQFSLVMIYQLAQGTGIPLTFLLNGYLLRYFPISRIYAFGMVLSGTSMLVMMLLGKLTLIGVATAGLAMGLAYGFFWANRVSLALISTTNENRNYYYGLEALFFTTASIAMPILGGILIAMAAKYNWFWNHPNGAYFVLTAPVIVLTVLAGLTIAKGDFKQPAIAKFVYFRFHRLWRKMLLMAGLKGLAQGFIIAAPVMLIMRLVGNEATMGSIQSLGAGLSAILLYLLGRFAKPQHRLKIYSFGLLLFFTGSLFNGFYIAQLEPLFLLDV